MNVKIKRAYEQPENDDGVRILVDRLWPRGLVHEKASINLWLKDIAPSTKLRQWFDHDPSKWEEFKQQYRSEIEANDEQLLLLKQELRKGAVTLVYAARDTEHNNAAVLQELLNS